MAIEKRKAIFCEAARSDLSLVGQHPAEDRSAEDNRALSDECVMDARAGSSFAFALYFCKISNKAQQILDGNFHAEITACEDRFLILYFL